MSRLARPVSLVGIALALLAGATSARAEYRAPRPVERTLANGLRVAVFPDPRFGVVQVQLVVPAGVAHEPAGQAGVASLTAQLLRHGTSSRSAAEWNAGIERLGGTVALSVSRDHASASAAFLAADLTAGLELLADAVSRPRFSDDELERMRRQLATAIAQQRGSAAGLADEHVWSLAMKQHPYAHSTLGSLTSLGALGRDAVHAFHRDRWRPHGSVLAIAGAIEPEAAFQAAESAFGTWSGRPAAHPAHTLAAVTPVIRIVDVPALPRAEIRVGARTPGRSGEPPSALTLAAAVLGGPGGASRLARAGDESARATLSSHRDAGLLVLAASARTDSARVVVERLQGALRSLAAAPPGAGELEAARRSLAGSHALALETMGGAMAQWLAAELWGMRYEDPATFAARLAAVPAAEVQAALAAPASAPVVVVVGRADVLRRVLEPLGAVEVVRADEGLERAEAVAAEGPPSAEEQRRGRELVQKAVHAHGGESKLRGIRSSLIAGIVAVADGSFELEGQIEQIRKAPDRMRMTTRFLTMDTQQILDGDRGWTRLASDSVSVTPADSLEVAGMRAGYAATVPATLLEALDPATPVAHRGQQAHAGREHQVVEVTGRDGVRRRLLFDLETGRLAVVEQREGGGATRRVYRDYRQVAGVWWPYLEERWIGDRRVMTISVRTVELNGDVPDDRFAEPRAPVPHVVR